MGENEDDYLDWAGLGEKAVRPRAHNAAAVHHPIND
jgi:hypothetical protein